MSLQFCTKNREPLHRNFAVGVAFPSKQVILNSRSRCGVVFRSERYHLSYAVTVISLSASTSKVMCPQPCTKNLEPFYRDLLAVGVAFPSKLVILNSGSRYGVAWFFRTQQYHMLCRYSDPTFARHIKSIVFTTSHKESGTASLRLSCRWWCWIFFQTSHIELWKHA